MTLKIVNRPDMLVFLKTASNVYSLIGMGVQEQMLSYNPKSDTKGYIHQLNSTTTVNGYEAQLNAPTDGWMGDPVFDYVDQLAIDFAVGSQLETEVVIVYPYRNDIATKHNAVIIINEKGGAHGEQLTLNYDIALNGDPVKGTATVDKAAGTCTFAATDPEV